ncbi:MULTISPECIES: hypothetical protein [Streptomyces]|uniref:Uncharacterized protein n=2 Tax=Streptomyces TaxID=1883 RepID=A0A100Y795_9ACTN|nr:MULTISPECIES: hypothetical protein [Streptomyces]KUH38949.1 hypothetical protein ATE80_09655 [Streptomyces kanasensis]UUS31542.1 hypothetical protein NRO40_12350 [Streptomyces changanensis]
MAQTRTPARRGKAPLLAGAYVGLVAAAALAHGILGAPDGWGPLLALVTFPGPVLVAFLGFYLLPPLIGGGEVEFSTDGGGVGPFDLLPQYAGGAVVNVLLAWGVVVFVRHFVREARSGGGHGGSGR